MVFTGVPIIDALIGAALGAGYIIIFAVFYVLAYFNAAGLDTLLIP